jgi:hypothetical protein
MGMLLPKNTSYMKTSGPLHILSIDFLFFLVEGELNTDHIWGNWVSLYVFWKQA